MITREKKQAVIAETQTHKKDVGSTAVQIGIMTKRIEELTGHLQTSKKDHMARRGLLQLVGERRRLLRYLQDKDSQAYLGLIKQLGLRK